MREVLIPMFGSGPVDRTCKHCRRTEKTWARNRRYCERPECQAAKKAAETARRKRRAVRV